MTREQITALLDAVARQELSPSSAVEKLANLPFVEAEGLTSGYAPCSSSGHA